MADTRASTDGNPRSRGFLELVQSWLQVLTVVVGAGWGLYTYFQHDKAVRAEAIAKADELNKKNAAQAVTDSRTRLIEAQKPFLGQQLTLYFETSQVAGRLVTESVSSPDWAKADKRFWQLYWSELSMVEHLDVARAMAAFKDQLVPIETKLRSGQAVADADLDPLRIATLSLADALRKGVESSWGNSGGVNPTIVAP